MDNSISNQRAAVRNNPWRRPRLEGEADLILHTPSITEVATNFDELTSSLDRHSFMQEKARKPNTSSLQTLELCNLGPGHLNPFDLKSMSRVALLMGHDRLISLGLLLPPAH